MLHKNTLKIFYLITVLAFFATGLSAYASISALNEISLKEKLSQQKILKKSALIKETRHE